MSRMLLRPLLVTAAFVAMAALLSWGLWTSLGARSRPALRVGSKAFTEAVILGEMLRLIGMYEGVSAEHVTRMGDTSKTWTALSVGDLDAYVEYTGTLQQEIFEREKPRSVEDVNRLLHERGLRMSQSLGFRNNYALGMREKDAAKRGIRTISDLKKHPDLRLGLSNAFIERGDGWHNLKRRYGLPFATPPAMQHALAYQSLAGGTLDVIDLYTTDAEILRYNLRVLEDDLGYFPAYHAVLLYRDDFAKKYPKVLQTLLLLEGTIDEKTMQELNSRVNAKENPETETEVAADFLNRRLNIPVTAEQETLLARLKRTTAQHLLLVLVSLLAAIVVAVPLGVLATRNAALGQTILALVAVVQTFPSLALLSFLILVLQRTGAAPAIVALFVYSLLPIVRNTYTGLKDVPLSIRESANALGLSEAAKLLLVEIPMASRSILAGIKTAAVINVGFATLGGLIGAGGYGQPIMSGLDKNNSWLILEGAVPAVLMALAVQGLFEAAERWLVPLGLRLKPAE